MEVGEYSIKTGHTSSSSELFFFLITLLFSVLYEWNGL